MNDEQLKETLSAFLDGQTGKIDTLEMRRLLREMESNPALLAAAERYVLASTVMRGGPVSPVSGQEFLMRLNPSLDALGDVPLRPSTGDIRPAVWRSAPAGKIAIAAAVAVLTIAAVRFFGAQQSGMDQVVRLAENNAAVAQPATVDNTVRPVFSRPVDSSVTGNQMAVSIGPHTVDASPAVAEKVDAAFEGSALEDHWSYHLEHASLNEGADNGCDNDGDEPDPDNIPWKLKLPAGYKLCSYEDTRDDVAADDADKVNPNVVVYSDGQHTLSVFVNEGSELANGQAAQDHQEGDTLLHAEQVSLGNSPHTITIIGEIPRDEALTVVHSLSGK